MRNPALLALAATLLMGSACGEKDDPSNPNYLKQPKAYQPKTAELTFNDDGLGKFNIMTDDEREAFLNDLKGKKGSFKGQAISKTGWQALCEQIRGDGSPARGSDVLEARSREWSDRCSRVPDGLLRPIGLRVE